MIKFLIEAIIREITAFLVHEKNFFSLGLAEREKALEKHKLKSPSLAAYMKELSAEEFMVEIKKLLEAVSYDDFSVLKSVKFAASLSDFLVKEFAEILDKGVDENGYSTFLSGELRAILASFSEEELADDACSFLAEFVNAPYLAFYTPRKISSEMRHEVRVKISEQYPNALLRFSVKKSLIGGFLFFRNGEIEDLSWLSRVRELLNA
jgi:hypothetical protein